MADWPWIIADSILLYYNRGSATWFLLSLFISEAIFCILLKAIKSKKSVLVICVLLYAIAACGCDANYIIWILFRSLHGLFFIAIGYYLGPLAIKWTCSLKGYVVMIALFAVAAICNGKVAMVDAKYGNIWIYTFASFLGSFLVMQLSRWITRYDICVKMNKFLQYWGRNSLIIVCSHMLFLRYGVDWVFGIGPRYPSLKGTAVLGFTLICEYVLITIWGKVKLVASQHYGNIKAF